MRLTTATHTMSWAQFLNLVLKALLSDAWPSYLKINEVFYKRLLHSNPAKRLLHQRMAAFKTVLHSFLIVFLFI